MDPPHLQKRRDTAGRQDEEGDEGIDGDVDEGDERVFGDSAEDCVGTRNRQPCRRGVWIDGEVILAEEKKQKRTEQIEQWANGVNQQSTQLGISCASGSGAPQSIVDSRGMVMPMAMSGGC